MEAIREKIQKYVDRIRRELLEVSRYIYDNPEVGFEERKASRKLVEVLKDHGYKVE
jgi:metal-dependent amidase/aminoacylase/carboxypeptidase family protein